MKIIKIAEAIAGVALIAAGGVDMLTTTIPGTILLADAFNVKL